MIVAEFVPSVAHGSLQGARPRTRRSTVHLVAPHNSRPDLEGRARVRALCGRGGRVIRVLAERPARICPDCRAIEPIGGER